MKTSTHTFTLAGLAALAAAGSSFAEVRNFSFLYESDTIDEGAFEYRQWVTWSTDKDIDSDFNRFDFRHEFGIGLTDRLQLSIFAPDWHIQDGDSVDDETEFDDVAVQGIFSFADPVDDPLGVAALGEARIGDEIVALEGRLILDKKWERLKGAYNVGLEAEWEGSDYENDNGLLTNALGLSYEVTEEFSLGGEFLHEVPIVDWDDTAKSVAWLGPNASFQQETWWVTLTPLFQLTDIETEADFQTRLLVGLSF